MSSLENIDFLGFPCFGNPDGGFGHKNIHTQSPYEAKYRAYQYERFKDIQPENIQGRVNCIRKTIELNRRGKTPVWFLENDFEHPNLEKTELNLSFEDFLNEPVNHAEKPYNLLKLLGHKLENKGISESVELNAEDVINCSIILKPRKNSGSDSDELKKISSYLESKSYIKYKHHTDYGRITGNPSTSPFHQFSAGEFYIEMPGWEYINETSKNIPTNKVFIAMAFSAWDNDQDTMRAIQTAIKNACKDKERKLDYEASIVEQDHLENISNKIIAQIKEAKFIVADFTHNNSGVYYEAGLAYGLGKPVIHLVRKEDSKKLHFDTTQINHLIWEKPEDIRRELPAWIKANIT